MTLFFQFFIKFHVSLSALHCFFHGLVDHGVGRVQFFISFRTVLRRSKDVVLNYVSFGAELLCSILKATENVLNGNKPNQFFNRKNPYHGELTIPLFPRENKSIKA